MPGRRSSSGKSGVPFGAGTVWPIARLAIIAIRSRLRTAGVNLFINNLHPLSFGVRAFSYRISGLSRLIGIIAICRTFPMRVYLENPEIMLNDLQAFILAGGASSRMGTDKSQLVIDQQTFTERIANT